MYALTLLPEVITSEFTSWQTLRKGQWALKQAQAVRDDLLAATRTACALARPERTCALRRHPGR
jgi:hypothetical protein